MSIRPEVPLQVITPDDVHASARRAKKSLEAAANEIVWQIEMEGWRTLGYSSWGAMREAEYGGVAFMVPSKSRPEIVARIKAVQVSRTARAAEKAVQVPVTHQCEGCGAEMTGRADKRFCSPACRQKAYRSRSAGKKAVQQA